MRCDDYYHPSTEGCIVFSSVRLCVCLSVCLSVNTITPELSEISSRNFQGIIPWSKGQTRSKTSRSIYIRVGGGGLRKSL